MINENAEESKAAYKTAKKEIRTAVYKAMEMQTQKIVEDIEGNSTIAGDGRRKLLEMARQHAKEKRDIVGISVYQVRTRYTRH